ncbi:GntR family transcriptional regulator [Zophobihabitans entericus]|uniref:GntR family transcriptional regulator n=1 Tax=Zophobihabitans entericus TaxID=1635327 RepID=A0A6G9IDB3_9GAMM|nr:GntR family transcriptional regulator [Zophobihabitans entericus]QIQ21694.1 GntR family transcriptional regulator [Zophobihabitans entericus]
MSNKITNKQQTVIDYITALIEKKNLSIDDKIDTEINIAQELGVTRVTVREATRHLIEEGLIYRIKGSGIHLGSPNNKVNLTGKFNVHSHFDYQAKKRGHKGQRKVISASIIPVPDKEMASFLKIKATDYVYYVKRLLSFDEIPVVLQYTYIPTYLIPQFEFSELEKSKFEYIEHSTGKKMKKQIQTITAVSATDHELVALLHITKNVPLLRLEEVTYLNDGTPCEYNLSYMRSEYNPVLHVTERK